MTSLTDLELLARLVAFDTTSATRRPTRPLGDFVCEYLEHPGIRIERFDCGDGQENLWFETGPGPTGDGAGLLLCGHVDVVPATEPEWTGDPFSLRIEGDRAIGRGVCDMKGFDAIAINVLRTAAGAGGLERPLAVLLTCNEEIGTVGAGRFAEQWRGRPIPHRTIVGEPTSERAVQGHKGHLSLSIEVGGRGCHTGFPDRGVNAVERAIPVLQALRDLREAMTGERTASSELFAETPFPVLTMATIDAGSAINVMPDRCALRVGARLLPGQSATDFLPRLAAAIESAGISVEIREGLEHPVPAGEIPLAEDACLITATNDTPSYAIDPSSPFLAEVRAIADDVDGRGVNFGTDAGRLVPLGCRSVIWGPGDISVAHRPDEWISIEEMTRYRDRLTRLVR
ncbi:MAG: M20 family metallopeptidase [Phycisphaera sp.]|nr:M20 family metallopeptidase [Phycisphaera sp.]